MEMKILQGVLAAFLGAGVGFAVAAFGSMAIAKAANASNREGALGYLALFAGLLGAVAGVVVAIWLVARRAPPGEVYLRGGAIFAAFLGVLAVAALGVWLFYFSKERPMTYHGSQASLELELRVPEALVAKDQDLRGFLNVEMQTRTTRPEGTLFVDRVRHEGDAVIVPGSVAPLYRASFRLLVVRVGEERELFQLRLGFLPVPRAEWSEWLRADFLDHPGGAQPVRAEGRGAVELRYRIHVYGS